MYVPLSLGGFCWNHLYVQAKLDLYPLEEIMLPTDQQPPKDMPQIAWSNSGEQRPASGSVSTSASVSASPPVLPLALSLVRTECVCYASIGPITADCAVLNSCCCGRCCFAVLCPVCLSVCLPVCLSVCR